MRKYWKFVVVAVVTVVTLAAFYIHTTTISKSFPQYTIETLTGDEAYAAPIIINGDLYSSYTTYEPFTITREGTTYLRDEPFFKRAQLYFPAKYIERLQQEYRSFMRGKEEFPTNYFETEDRLYYATIPFNNLGIRSNHVNIEVLDKETHEVQKFTFPLNDDLKDVYLTQVVAYQDELFIVVEDEEYSEETGEREKLNAHVYTFNVATEEVTSTDFKYYTGKNYPEFSRIHIAANDGVPKQMLFSASYVDYVTADGRKINEENDEYYSEQIFEIANTEKVYVFDFATREVNEFTIEGDEHIGAAVGFDGEKVTFINVEKDELIVKQYDLNKKTIVDKNQTPIENFSISLWNIMQGITKDQLFYTFMISEDSKSGDIFVIDTASLEFVYHGKITSEEQEDVTNEMEISIHEIDVAE